MDEAKISIVVPAYNEAGNLAAMRARLEGVLRDREGYEILFVDDGSQDETLALLRDFASEDARIRFLSLSRNFGHQSALKAGLDNATGDCVITLDADLQHPPEVIPEMIERWQAGFEVVNTVRADAGAPFFKHVTSGLFYRFLNFISDIEIRPGAADFRLLDRKVVRELVSLGDRTLFLRGAVPWLGFRQCDIDYTPDKRASGEPKYNLRRMALLAIDGITSSSIRPLRLSTFVGAIMSGFATLYAGYALMTKLILGTAISGWASLLVGMMLLGGVQLLMLGIIGEYLGKVLLEVKGRPSYVVRERSAPAEQDQSGGHSPVAELQARLEDPRALP